MSHSAGSAIYRAPNKKGASDFRPKYGPYDQNGGGGGGMANRYMATGPTGKKTIGLVENFGSIHWKKYIYAFFFIIIIAGHHSAFFRMVCCDIFYILSGILIHFAIYKILNNF